MFWGAFLAAPCKIWYACTQWWSNCTSRKWWYTKTHPPSQRYVKVTTHGHILSLQQQTSKTTWGISLVVQWLGLRASNAGEADSIPGYSQASLAAVCQDKDHPELRGGQASNCSTQAYPKPCPSLGGRDQCSISQESSLEPGGQLLPWERAAQRKEGVPSYTNQAKLNLALKTKTASHPAFIFMLANLQMLLGSVRVGACVRVSVLTET